VSLFGAIDTSGTGVDAMQTWIDTDAGNIANANDAVSPGQTPYQEQEAVFSPTSQSATADGQPGVQVAVDEVSSPGQLETDADDPSIGKNGEIVMPAVSISDQLVGLIQAQEGYQADTSAISRALTAYQAGMQIGS
jgi:flagellar basal-body rod protein FlgC